MSHDAAPSHKPSASGGVCVSLTNKTHLAQVQVLLCMITLTKRIQSCFKLNHFPVQENLATIISTARFYENRSRKQRTSKRMWSYWMSRNATDATQHLDM